MGLFDGRKSADIMVARFENSGALLNAAGKINEAGYKNYDCHSPFPIHGMDQAMGLKRSPVGYVVGVMGAIGLVGSMTLQWWTSTIAYPLVISGKPFFSWQAYVPVTFALTVLLSAFGALFGFLGITKLPRLYHPLFFSKKFAAFSNDSFFVSIEADDANYNSQGTAEFLKSIGGSDVEVIEDE